MGAKATELAHYLAKQSRKLLRAGGSAVNPDFHLRDGVCAGERRESAPRAGVPAPADQLVGRNVFEQLRERAAAGLLGIFELAAQLGRRAPEEHHFVLRRGERPLWISRRQIGPGQIRGLVAGVAAHAVDAVAIFAALHILQMDMAVVALQGRVPGGVAVLATRRSKNSVELQKCFAGGVRVRLRSSRRSANRGDGGDGEQGDAANSGEREK